MSDRQKLSEVEAEDQLRKYRLFTTITMGVLFLLTVVVTFWLPPHPLNIIIAVFAVFLFVAIFILACRSLYLVFSFRETLSKEIIKSKNSVIVSVSWIGVTGIALGVGTVFIILVGLGAVVWQWFVDILLVITILYSLYTSYIKK